KAYRPGTKRKARRESGMGKRRGVVSEAAQPECRWRRKGMAPTLRLAAVIALVHGLIAFAGTVGHAIAQGRGARTVEVDETIIGEAATQVAFPIRVGPPALVPQNSFVRVRGLPPTVALSDGYSIAPGFWAIPLRALANLKMLLPIGAQERAD